MFNDEHGGHAGERPVFLHGARQLDDAEHNHDDADHGIRPLEQQNYCVSSVKVAHLATKVVGRAGQAGHACGQRPAGAMTRRVHGNLQQPTDARVTMAQHVVLKRDQVADGRLAQRVDAERKDDGHRNCCRVQPYARRVRGQQGGRVVLGDRRQQRGRVVLCGRVPVRVPDEHQHAFGAGQCGRLVAVPIEHGAD